jgi:hypothetical protein
MWSSLPNIVIKQAKVSLKQRETLTTKKGRPHHQSSEEGKGLGSWWLKPVIPATQEAEIRRIVVGSQPGQVVPETLS